MKKLLLSLVVLIAGISCTFGQGEINGQDRIFFRNEKTFAVILNTDGWGLSYRLGKRIDYLNKKIIDIDFGYLRDSKEVKISNPVYETPGSFVFGKVNTVFYLRGGYGHQHEIYKKADLGGVAIRFFYSGGPILAFYKPIYYKILIPLSNGEFDIQEQKFDIKKLDPTMIYSKASFFKGFDELKVLPGIFGKAGFNFEYSKEDKIIHAVEFGAQLNVFPKEIPIMATQKNKALFFSLFLSYRFGVVIDPTNKQDSGFNNIFHRRRPQS
ncbi:MAG TPA: hypothetical protein VMT63_03905 [Bacteroidales bacterium]|nr:hypothetical protein [Bacteroidales bacterium]